MVISTKYSGDRFVDVFTHELSHRLLTDNDKYQIETARRKLGGAWAELFGKEHSFKTLVHIPVHALLEYIFVDVLDEPQRLERDKEYLKKHADYDDAWKYVAQAGYKNIIDKLAVLYDTYLAEQ